MMAAWSFLDAIWHLRLFSAFTGQHSSTLSQQEAVEARHVCCSSGDFLVAMEQVSKWIDGWELVFDNLSLK